MNSKTPAAANARSVPFGMYIHWPFCVSKCPYCDFNSHVAPRINDNLWRDMLIRECETLLARFETLGNPTSIFFGGGTPSLMPPKTVAAILNAIGKFRHLDADVEISLEANPESVQEDRLREFRAAGVNRLSIGVQSLDDAALRALGRPHDSAMALAALEAARRCVPRVSADLIYARPRQTLAQWRDELDRILQEEISHISLYQLTIEPNTPYARWHASGKLALPAEETALEQWETARELCAEAGLPHYEISNHARPGEECRHNLLYWRYGFYLGVGPGAHGRLPGAREGERIATENVRDPAAWCKQVATRGDGMERQEPLSAREQQEEMLMMGLRLREGVETRRLGFFADAPERKTRMESLLEDGLLWRERKRIGCTPQGERVLNGILAHLLA